MHRVFLFHERGVKGSSRCSVAAMATFCLLSACKDAPLGQSNAERIQNHPTQAKGRCTVKCSGLCFPHFYLAVLIKLRLSHRYLMPEMAVAAATSQHRAMETTTTMETLSTVPR